MKRILCVFAHPDDESYGPGGTIARYAIEGVEVHILMFTCGEAGSIGVSKELARDELCRRRRVELQRACDSLGVQSHRVLGVPDKGVGHSDADAAVKEIRSDIARLRPQILMTFHHRGVSQHPDHIAVAAFLERAFDEEDVHPPQRLWQWGIPHEKARLYERPNLDTLRPEEIHARIDVPADAMDRKVAAIRDHETQVDFFRSLEGMFDYRSVSTPECFELRRNRGKAPTTVLSDLFEGVDA